MHSLIHLATILTLSSRTLSDCFFPNGDRSFSDTICNPDALVSSCCYDNQACLSNGLCVSDPLDAQKARIHRGTCSDKTWKSGNCPRSCLSVEDNGAPVYPCNQTGTDSYCCFDNCKCNDDTFETFKFPDLDVYTVTIIGAAFTQTHQSSTSSSSTPSSSTVASISTHDAPVPVATSASNPVEASNLPLSSDAAAAPTSSGEPSQSTSSVTIGVGVGVSVGAALLLGAGAFFFFWRRGKNKEQQQQQQQHDHHHQNFANNPYANDTAASTHGIPNYSEMDNNEAPVPYFPTQKYAHYASESPVAPSQRSINDEHLFNTPPVELASNPRSDPVELPASPSYNSKMEKKRPF
ncbi:unnamed protein product [Periconia digitata]|uniref:Uncharacterized protein n=1 Tax=Periconia digitata TaxID=1303443 RepID=A0A9W4XSA9_9PLEO|nr:unnamed protein product [Periconia digitata]